MTCAACQEGDHQNCEGTCLCVCAFKQSEFGVHQFEKPPVGTSTSSCCQAEFFWKIEGNVAKPTCNRCGGSCVPQYSQG